MRINKYEIKSFIDKFWRGLAVLMLVLFLPVLFCVFFIGNRMDYNDGLKMVTLAANPVLFFIALAVMMICLFLIRLCGKFPAEKRKNLIADFVLLILFVILYFVNIRVTRDIAFKIPWDIMVVREHAYRIAQKQPLGYIYYLSIYYNNIPISYVLGKLYRWAAENGRFVCVPDDIWLQVNCILLSAGGYFSCLTVKKLTKNLMAAALCFGLYLFLAITSPWKMAPYTDTFGMIFPIMGIYFYVWYREHAEKWQALPLLALSLVSIALGGFLKPSVYVIAAAVLGTECVLSLGELKRRWPVLCGSILFFAVLLTASGKYTDKIIEEIGLEYNEEIEAGWQHYFHMGLNEETTGSFNSDDKGIFGEIQDSKSKRNAVLLERSVERLRERGFFGTLYFWLRKMTMNFNDGGFGWRTEVWVDSYYPPELAANTEMTSWLRSKFWPEGDEGRINTFWQLVWLFGLLGIPGICLSKKEEAGKYAVLIVSFLGIFFYQMLFEARARYLFVFLPLLLAVSVCGIWQYSVIADEVPRKRKERKKQS